MIRLILTIIIIAHMCIYNMQAANKLKIVTAAKEYNNNIEKVKEYSRKKALRDLILAEWRRTYHMPQTTKVGLVCTISRKT